jgi:6-phosphogluconolactonase
MELTEYNFSEKFWAKEAAFLIQEEVENVLQNSEYCNIFLTGGTAAEILYNEWSEIADFKTTRNLVFYFGDERCVSPDDINCNYKMTLNSLFKYGFPVNSKVYRMKGESSNTTFAAREYELLIPEKIDILLLGIGLDGHIASIFPDSEKLFVGRTDLVLPVYTNKFPEKRLTITPRVVKRAKRTYILAFGNDKYSVLNNIRNNSPISNNYPVRLVSDSIWLTTKNG